MKRYFFCLMVLLIPLASVGNDATQELSGSAPAGQPEVRLEFHQREEGETAPPLLNPEYELMTQPCMGWRFQTGLTLYNAEAGRELMLLTSSVEMGGAALVVIALQNNASISLQIQGTAGAWAMASMKGDRAAIGTYFDGSIHIYDLPTDKFTAVVDIPGEAYIWNLVEGMDGRLYGGTFPGGKLIALDQDTLEMEDCGQVAAPNRFVHEVSALPDGRLLCRAGDEAPAMRLYDPATKTFTEIPKILNGITGGVVWNEYFVTRSMVFDKELQPVSPPPFPVPDEGRGDWFVLTSVTDQHRLFLQQGDAVYRYEAGEDALTLVYAFDLRGGTLMAPTVDGGLVGVRGQQYFHIKTGDTALNRQQVSIASPPRVPVFLRTDQAGQVWGAPDRGQTLFFMDGQTGVFVSMGAVTPAPGGVYDVAFVNGVAYGVCSPGGALFRLDIEAPWYEWDGKNPKMLDTFAEKGYPQPTGGILASHAARVYSGWSAAAGVYGGAIAVTEPETDTTRMVENPLGRQGITGLAADEQYLFAGTTLTGKDLPVKQDEFPQFAVLGLDTLQPYWNHSFEAAVTVDRLLYNPSVDKVAMAVDGVLRVFSVNDMRMLPSFEQKSPTITSAGLAERNDACVYYGHQNRIVRTHLETGAWEQVLEMPAEVGAITGSEGGTLYAACGVDVYRVNFPDVYTDDFPSQSEETE